MEFRTFLLVTVLFAAVLSPCLAGSSGRKTKVRAEADFERYQRERGESGPEERERYERSEQPDYREEKKEKPKKPEKPEKPEKPAEEEPDPIDFSEEPIDATQRSESESGSQEKPHYSVRRIPPFRYYLEQSPIHIKSRSRAVGFDRLLKPLKFNYHPAEKYTLKNTGHGFVVKFGANSDSFVSGGPLEQPYFLANMQVRWGKKNSRGSEHRVNGRTYAAEVQLVHFNKYKYGTFDEASRHGDGLAVVSVFLKLTHQTNHVLHILAKFLDRIPKKSMKVELRHLLNLPELLPKQYQKFWTYPGSLTTRPFTENAIWIVLRNPIEFSKRELEAFRNFRPTNRRRLQPLNDRVIRSSFHKLGKLGKW